jgi:hypothetical protein
MECITLNGAPCLRRAEIMKTVCDGIVATRRVLRFVVHGHDGRNEYSGVGCVT